MTTPLAAPATNSFQFAACIEAWYQMFDPNAAGQPNIATFRDVVRQVRSLGYTGVEMVAPLIGEDVPLADYAAELDQQGAAGIGLHWALALTKGLHLCTPDAAVMKATEDYIVGLAHKTAALCRGRGVIVHGSPLQRSLARHDVSHAVGMRTAGEIYRNVMKRIEGTGVVIAFEQLGWSETDMFTTMADVLELQASVDHPNFSYVLDVKALLDKCATADEVGDAIRLYGPGAVHFHANDKNLSGPGCGDIDFLPIFQALADIGWHKPSARFGFTRSVSVEVFDFKKKPIVETLTRSIEYMRQTQANVRWAA